MTRRPLLLALGFGLATIALTARGPQERVNQSRDGLAMQGYDPVSYVAAGRPARGTTAFETRWNGATWRFASAANRDAFANDPDRYAPRFGGYCAYAVSRGYTANGDPRVWRVVDGRLYLNYSAGAQALWEKDVPGNIAKGNANWPAVLGR
jgi:hypothetical protein